MSAMKVALADVAVHHGVNRQSRHAFYAEFSGDVFAMGEHGVETDVQSVGDLLVYKSCGYETKYLDLAL